MDLGVKKFQNVKVYNFIHSKIIYFSKLTTKIVYSTEITCDDPETIDSLLVDSGTKAVGVFAKFSCPKGRFIVGNDTRTCLKSGKWSGKNPICKNVSLSVYISAFQSKSN